MLHPVSVLDSKGYVGGRLEGMLCITGHVSRMPCDAVLYRLSAVSCSVIRCVGGALVRWCSGALVDGCSICAICSCARCDGAIGGAVMRLYY